MRPPAGPARTSTECFRTGYSVVSWTARNSPSYSSCDYAVYTVGFSPRPIPAAPQWGQLECNAANGIIAPGLFGVGIAFPEYRIDPTGFGNIG